MRAMKARFLFLPLLVALALATTAFALAQEPAPPIEGEIDLGELEPGQVVGASPQQLTPYLERLVANIAIFQDGYHRQWGIYAQTLSPFADPPTDGRAELPPFDTKDRAPTSGVSVETLYLVAGMEAFPANVRVDVYCGPWGCGYVLIAETKFAGVLWHWAGNVGPEVDRTADWVRVEVYSQ
jgi:hypothetical protein